MILKTKDHCKQIYLLGRKSNGDVFFFLDTDTFTTIKAQLTAIEAISKMKVQVPKDTELSTLEIFNLAGCKIKTISLTNNKTVIPLTGMMTGTYIFVMSPRGSSRPWCGR